MQRVRHANRGRLLPPDTWSYPIWDLHLFIQQKPNYLLMTLSEHDLFTELYITELERFQQNICNGCGMPAGGADSSGHLVLSNFWTCMCSNVETNLSWTCLVSGLLNFEHPSVLLFCLRLMGRLRFRKPVYPHQCRGWLNSNWRLYVGQRSLCYEDFGGVS